MEEALERFDLCEPGEDLALLFHSARLLVLAGFDDLTQPQALLVATDVLDLVGDRATVRLVQLGVRLGERPSRDVDPQYLGRDPGHDLGGQAELARIERRVAGGLRAERVEPRRHVPEVAERLDQRHRGREVTQVFGMRDAGWEVRGRRCHPTSRIPHPASR